jgi:arsenate reductase
MGWGFFRHLASDRAIALSGGSDPADQIDPAAVSPMAEKGIDITAPQPRRWTDEISQSSLHVKHGADDGNRTRVLSLGS